MTGTPFEFAPAFAGQVQAIEGFQRVQASADAALERVRAKVGKVFDEIDQRVNQLDQEFRAGKLSDAAFESMYAKLVRRLEEEFSRQ